jgi:hypothetical protein
MTMLACIADAPYDCAPDEDPTDAMIPTLAVETSSQPGANRLRPASSAHFQLSYDTGIPDTFKWL